MAGSLAGVVGPTASGKTELVLALARRLPVEVLVADSRQVYRGMDVGTAKPDATARAAVRHHLLDLVDPDEPFTVADWVGHARRAAAEVGSRGRLPALVGGTGLYVSALLDGHDYRGQPRSPALRQRLTDALETDGLAALVDRLRVIDPDAASRIDVRNPRRVVRAIERAQAGGGGVAPTSSPFDGAVTLIAIDRPREVTHRRIDARAEWMFGSGGLLAEVRALLEAGFGPELRPMTGHGYREAARHLAGEWSLEQAIESTARHTRQYAKRQLTWFRRDARIRWIPADDAPADDPGVIATAEAMLRSLVS